MKTCVFWTLILCAVLTISPAVAQSLGNAGIVEGVVVDQSGAVIARAVVGLYNPVTEYRQSVMSAVDGAFRLVNIPPNQYRRRASGFQFLKA